jgi:hypothetical protein
MTIDDALVQSLGAITRREPLATIGRGAEA